MTQCRLKYDVLLMTQCRSVIDNSNTKMTQCRSGIDNSNTKMTPLAVLSVSSLSIFGGKIVMNMEIKHHIVFLT